MKTSGKALAVLALAAALIFGAVAYYFNRPENAQPLAGKPPVLTISMGGSLYQGQLVNQELACNPNLPGHKFTAADVSSYVAPASTPFNTLKIGEHLYHSDRSLPVSEIIESIQPVADNKVLLVYYDPNHGGFKTYPAMDGKPQLSQSDIIDRGNVFILISCQESQIYGINDEKHAGTLPSELYTLDGKWILVSQTGSIGDLATFSDKLVSVFYQNGEGYDFEPLDSEGDGSDLNDAYKTMWLRLDSDLVAAANAAVDESADEGEVEVVPGETGVTTDDVTPAAGTTGDSVAIDDTAADGGNTTTVDGSDTGTAEPSVSDTSEAGATAEYHFDQDVWNAQFVGMAGAENINIDYSSVLAPEANYEQESYKDITLSSYPTIILTWNNSLTSTATGYEFFYKKFGEISKTKVLSQEAYDKIKDRRPNMPHHGDVFDMDGKKAVKIMSIPSGSDYTFTFDYTVANNNTRTYPFFSNSIRTDNTASMPPKPKLVNSGGGFIDDEDIGENTLDLAYLVYKLPEDIIKGSWSSSLPQTNEHKFWKFKVSYKILESDHDLKDEETFAYKLDDSSKNLKLLESVKLLTIIPASSDQEDLINAIDEDILDEDDLLEGEDTKPVFLFVKPDFGNSDYLIIGLIPDQTKYEFSIRIIDNTDALRSEKYTWEEEIKNWEEGIDILAL